LHSNRNFFPIFHYFLGLQYRQDPRYTIHFLENDHWQTYFRCLVLHPLASFPIQRHDRNSKVLYYNLGPLAEIIDIYPYKKLIFHD
ncbi:hypothetical protein BO83DRAFT_282588, partial [Aspergillus eucalypticola CBS 122712]